MIIEVFALLLAAQAVRYLLFVHGTLDFVWRKFYNVPVIGKFLKCAFCQGFWIGLIAFIFILEPVMAVLWGLASGWISYTWDGWINDEKESRECPGSLFIMQAVVDKEAAFSLKDELTLLGAEECVCIPSDSGNYIISAVVDASIKKLCTNAVFIAFSARRVIFYEADQITSKSEMLDIPVRGHTVSVEKLSWEDSHRYLIDGAGRSDAAKKTGLTEESIEMEIYNKLNLLDRKENDT